MFLQLDSATIFKNHKTRIAVTTEFNVQITVICELLFYFQILIYLFIYSFWLAGCCVHQGRVHSWVDCYTVLLWWLWDCHWGMRYGLQLAGITFFDWLVQIQVRNISIAKYYELTWLVGISMMFQRPLTVPLHNPNGRDLPLGLCKLTVKEYNSSPPYVSVNQVSTASGNGLSPIRCQAII